ncbi:hypothetical protein Clacol_001337 [Clathrus columnatus]|uniref:Uncharacterized protein n=1 Tax=Clathrus columnatus TaxID=1419009 RepID=A0AAV5A143_9AGAM|nr:hypothetical protein Clacol_001337 [Clathrus columnatus]
MGTKAERQMVKEWVKHTSLIDDLFIAHISPHTLQQLQNIAARHGFANVKKLDQVSAIIGRHSG